MAKAKQIEDTAPAAEPVTDTIVYVPGDGDPPITRWAGQTFHANVPKELTGHAEGTAQEKLNLHIIERARDPNQKHFRAASQKVQREAPSLPTNSDEYLAYFVGWLNQKYESADSLVARYAKDLQLQVACEVGIEDYARMGALLMPKLHELAKAEEMTERQTAQLWVNHGVNQLPW